MSGPPICLQKESVLLNRFKIGHRLVGLLVIIFMLTVVTVGVSLVSLHSTIMDAKLEKIHDMVHFANSSVLDYYNRFTQGKITEKEAQSRALNMIEHIRYGDGDGDYVWINDMSGKFLVHPTKKGVNAINATDPTGFKFMQAFVETAKKGGDYVHYKWAKEAGKEPTDKASYVMPFKPWGWVLGTGVYLDDVNAIFMKSILHIGIVQFFIFAIGCTIAFFVTKSIVKPVSEISHTMTKMAEGDLRIFIPAVDHKDEIGEMANSLKFFKESMVKTRELQEQAAEAEKHAQLERSKDMARLAHDFEKSVESIVTNVAHDAEKMMETAEHLSTSITKAQGQANEVAGHADAASRNVKTVAGSADELTLAIEEISGRVVGILRETQQASSQALRTQENITILSQNAGKIDSIVELVQQIAGQTNLLALNATIEAARAGEAGKGFAVVASEVKSLAHQTAEATQEISSQIALIQSSTGGARDEIEEMTKTISQINELMTSVAASVEEQRAATQEIARSVDEAAKGTQAVSANTNEILEETNHTDLMARESVSASAQLCQQTSSLRDVVHAFVERVHNT
ncbi:MAG: hypothetical protein C0514_04405 [Candidatus Puniceispirillum sp.]|nr:hypothetical protein [Candidatus Puniceispirillum sp.]